MQLIQFSFNTVLVKQNIYKSNLAHGPSCFQLCPEQSDDDSNITFLRFIPGADSTPDH